MSDQMDVLKHIADFAARIRGHELEAWRDQEGLASAQCARCRRELQVIRTLTRIHMDGEALASTCLWAGSQFDEDAPGRAHMKLAASSVLPLPL
jgi:hypothetical protein